MKLKIIVLFGVFFMLFQQLSAEMKVKFFVGDSSYKSMGSEEWQKISMNQVLTNGDTVKTASKAYVQLDMDGNLIKISENSQVTIGEDFDDNKKVNAMDMEYGNLQLKMNKLKKANKGFKVNTVSSVCAVRGTEFIVSTGMDGTTLLQVEKGRVALAGETKEVVVNENQQSSVPYGGDPTEIKVISKTEWNKWFEEKKANVKGNELNLLQTSLEKLESIEKEILDLEKIRQKNLEDKENFDKLAKDAKAAGNDDVFKENASNAYKALRNAHNSLYKTHLKAKRMEMLMQMAKRIYTGIETDDRSDEIVDTYKKIETIYNKYFEKYIKETIEARREMDESRRNNK